MNFKLSLPEPGTSALDFAPEILAIQERPPSPLPRTVLNTLLVLLVILLTWSMIGKLDIMATAEGKLVPQTYVKIVQPADAGIIKEFLIKEGDYVRAGQVLLRMDTTVSDADSAIVGKEVELRRLQMRRIDAELKGAAMTRGGDAASTLYGGVEAQASARSQAYQDALSTERAGLAQAEADMDAAQEQLVKLEKVLPTYREQEQALSKLSQEGLIARFQYADKQRELIETEQNLLSQRRTVQGLQSRITEFKSRIARITSDYRQQLLTERVEAEAALGKGVLEQGKQVHRGSLSELRAPQDGIIKDVATYTVGAVVNAGTVLMSLVPVGEKLQAEILISNEDVGFVTEGQSVKVKLAAYPFQKYGMLEGIVERLAVDASSDQATNSENSSDEGVSKSTATYKALVRLEKQELVKGDSKLSLASGMRIVAEIKQGERTVLEYLLSPVQKVVNEAGRER